MKTILVVDDESAIAETLQAILESEGYVVVTAPNGRVALALLESRPVDLVISDLMMPLLDGIGLARAIQSQPRYAHIPLVLMSAGRQRPTEAQVAFSAFLSKPFQLNELLALTGHLLGPS